MTARISARDSAYAKAHWGLRRDRGRAAEQDCIDCARPAYAWSLKRDAEGRTVEIGGRHNGMEYSHIPSDYEPRCGKCHRAYDYQPGDRCNVTGCELPRDGFTRKCRRHGRRYANG